MKRLLIVISIVAHLPIDAQNYIRTIHNDSVFLVKYNGGDSVYCSYNKSGYAYWHIIDSVTQVALNLKANLASPTFTGSPVVPGYVPTTTTVNGHALSGNVSVTTTDLSLNNLSNNAQLTIANNLSDLNNAGTARTNLGVSTTANISASTNKNFVTDAQATVIGNTSNTNSGDNATNSQYSGLVSNATHTGDATGATALTVVRINGTSLAGLATGILKNTTTTGVPSIAAQADVTALLGAGSISNTMIANGAVANLSGTNTGDQTTVSGNAGTATALQTSRNINGVAFNGTANIAVTGSTENADIVTGSSGINTTETVIVKTAALAANRLAAGTTIRITWMGTCTSTAANVSTFAVRIGTAGTTSDGLMQSAATAVAATSGTAIPFKAVLEITIRTAGSSATSHGFLTLIQTGVTGIAAQTTQVILPTFTNFNSTTASNIISATYKSAASTTTCTFQDAIIEFIYL